jgi:hypothetical protein
MIRTSKSVSTSCILVAGLLALAAALLPAPASASAEAAATERHLLPIGAARELPAGTVVTVMGSVTVPSGTFSSSFGDEGFAIQDATGGIYVSIADNLDIKLQQRVQVTGVLTESSGLLTVVPAADGDVTVLGRGFKVRPHWERTGNVGPANQGLLVFVVGIITGPIEPDPPFGSKFNVTDGSGLIRIFINTSSGIDISTLAPGQLLSVTGFSSAFDTPEIDPRFQSDLHLPLP